MSSVTPRRKGISLSRGPALALGTFLVIAGLYFIYMEHGFPRLSQFPNAHQSIDGKAFFGVFGLNGWSGELTVAAGGLLLFGAAQHLLAKTASLIVAIVLGGVGIWALVNHHSALGLFAANIWTILLWFAAAAYLLINALLPRAGGRAEDDSYAQSTTRPVAAEPVAAQPVATQPVAAQPVAAQPVVVTDRRAGTAEAVPTTTVPSERQTVTNEPNIDTNQPDTTVRNEPDTTVRNEPDTVVTSEPDTATSEPGTITSVPGTVTSEPGTVADEPTTAGTEPATDTDGSLRRPATHV